MEKHMKFDEHGLLEDEENRDHRRSDITKIPKALADDKWSKLVSRILTLESKELKEMQRHVQMQNNTDDFLTKLDLIEKYPQLFAASKNHKVEMTKEEIEVLRALIIEKEGSKPTFAQRNTQKGRELMNKKVKNTGINKSVTIRPSMMQSESQRNLDPQNKRPHSPKE